MPLSPSVLRLSLAQLLVPLVVAIAAPALAQATPPEEEAGNGFRDPLFTERDSEVRQLGLDLKDLYGDEKGKLCQGWPVKACQFNVLLESFTNIEGPFGDKKGTYRFITSAGGYGATFPGLNSDGSAGFYIELAEGATRTVNGVIDTHVVGCGESKRIPYLVFAEEKDGMSSNEFGERTGELLLECKPGVTPQRSTFRVNLANKSGTVKHKVDVTLRTEVANSDHCGPVTIHETNIVGGECEVEVRFDRVMHDDASEGSSLGTFLFEVSAGGAALTLPPNLYGDQPYYFIRQGTTQTVDKQVAVHRIGCGQRKRVPIQLYGREKDGFYDDTGTATGYIELSCPMKTTTVQVDLTLYGNGSGKARHYLQALFSARDLGWSAFNAEGVNQCCQQQKCKSPCPVIGSFDGANCHVATAPPPPAQPFILNPTGFSHELYYTPVNGQCTVGTSDTANCHVASVPADRASPFIYQRNHYVRACHGACPRACPDIGTFDGANCHVATAPAGSQAFLWGGAFYHSPVNGQCALGQFDGANCFVAQVPPSANPFIWENAFYVTACKP